MKAVILIVLVALIGCSSALHRPVELTQPAESSTKSTTERLAVAQAEFADRSEAGAHRAAALYSAIAAVGKAEGDYDASHDGLIGAIRTRVWLAAKLDDAAERRGLALSAVNAGQLCERDFPADAACAYWLALAVGSQARERRSTAVDGLDVMEDRLRKAIAIDPALDHAGPHRVLALLYLRAPGWPTGPGDPDAGFEQAQIAVTLDGSYPPNLLVLGEALAALDEAEASRDAFLRARQSAERFRVDGHPEAEEWITKASEALQSSK